MAAAGGELRGQRDEVLGHDPAGGVLGVGEQLLDVRGLVLLHEIDELVAALLGQVLQEVGGLVRAPSRRGCRRRAPRPCRSRSRPASRARPRTACRRPSRCRAPRRPRAARRRSCPRRCRRCPRGAAARASVAAPSHGRCASGAESGSTRCHGMIPRGSFRPARPTTRSARPSAPTRRSSPRRPTSAPTRRSCPSTS